MYKKKSLYKFLNVYGKMKKLNGRAFEKIYMQKLITTHTKKLLFVILIVIAKKIKIFIFPKCL